ncbi:uncharacterized protein PV09_04197 [Verruconis gallopava]|uniref:Uncharacterized protein n=1 Tax=Verruconis gallopava TaxID=253628 RepID=A0A0D1XQW7_9PEZI|nr:uncharacterized protein PV09_04197 [Verruconis gallopava]KIW05041.1 hypothetical protein PV09_04197 [Verruconis gallopava]
MADGSCVQESFVRGNVARSQADKSPGARVAKDGRRSPIPMLKEAKQRVAAKEAAGAYDEYAPIERVASRKNNRVLICTERQWEAYKSNLARATALARFQEAHGQVFPTDSTEYRRAVENVDVEAELAFLKGSWAKKWKARGWPHGKGNNKSLSNRWDYRVELGENPGDHKPGPSEAGKVTE